jgi:protein involved in temperature-dependent protein secretion
MSGHNRLRLRPTGSSEPADREKHQDHQAERDSGGDHGQAYPGQLGRRHRRVLADVAQDDTCRHEEGAGQHRRGSRNCQEEDETQPPGSGGMGAHWSTIASRLPARKPNG